MEVITAGQLNAHVAMVIGSKPDLQGVERASAAKVMNFVVDRKQFSDVTSFSNQIFKLCEDADVGLICLAGWLCLLDVPERWAGRVMNIHPALLPSFGGTGMYGAKVHEAVINYGCKVSGCTVHFADQTYDSGPIILQRTCPVLDADTPATLAHRVFEEEKIAYPRAIELFAQKRLKLEGRRVVVSPEE